MAAQRNAVVRERDKLAYVVARCQRWASWKRLAFATGTGLAGSTGTSVIGRLAGERAEQRRQEQLRQKAGESKTGRRRSMAGEQVFACMIHGEGTKVDVDYEAWETDQAIETMPKGLRRVLRINYLDERSQQEKADRHGYGYRRYKDILGKAHLWLSAYFTALGKLPPLDEGSKKVYKDR